MTNLRIRAQFDKLEFICPLPPLIYRGETDCFAVCGDRRTAVEGIVTRRKYKIAS